MFSAPPRFMMSIKIMVKQSTISRDESEVYISKEALRPFSLSTLDIKVYLKFLCRQISLSESNNDKWTINIIIQYLHKIGMKTNEIHDDMVKTLGQDSSCYREEVG